MKCRIWRSVLVWACASLVLSCGSATSNKASPTPSEAGQVAERLTGYQPAQGDPDLCEVGRRSAEADTRTGPRLTFLQPTRVSRSTSVHIAAQGFPPRAPVVVRLVKPGSGFATEPLSTIAAEADGAINGEVSIPADFDGRGSTMASTGLGSACWLLHLASDPESRVSVLLLVTP